MADLLRRTPYRYTRIPGEAAEDAQVRWALDLAARVGELMLRCGAGAPQVVGQRRGRRGRGRGRRASRSTSRCSRCSSRRRAPPGARTPCCGWCGAPGTTTRGWSRCTSSCRRSPPGRSTRDEADRRLRQIKRTRRIFPVWAVSVASALLASAVAVMIGASAFAALATVLVVLAVTAVNRLYARTALPEFYANAINALVATLLAGCRLRGDRRGRARRWRSRTSRSSSPAASSRCCPGARWPRRSRTCSSGSR